MQDISRAPLTSQKPVHCASRVLAARTARCVLAKPLASQNRERRSVNERVTEVDSQLKSLNGRLDRLYVALETGHVDMADLGPRIKALRDQIANTEEQKREILATEASPLRFSGAEVRRYVDDLRELLADGTLMERKSWLRTWVKRVSIDRKRGGTIEYKLPLASLKQESRPTRGGSLDAVLSTDQIGCGTRIRT